jgi:DNA-binding transcriptional ArsR family regulator
LSQSAVSHQLRVLRDRGLVRSRKEGRRAYYHLDDEHVSTLYRQAHEHARHLDGVTA